MAAARLEWGGAAAAASAPPTPEARTGGAEGGPIAILFLSPYPQIDAQYAEELEDQGFAFTSHRYYEPLTYEFVRRFNVSVIDKLPVAAPE